MNDEKKLFKNEIICDIHVQGAQDIRSSEKNIKFLYKYILPKELPSYINHVKSAIWY